MCELTITEQEICNGGWNWWAAGRAGFSFAGGALEYLGDLGMEVPPVGGALELAGAACGFVGALMN